MASQTIYTFFSQIDSIPTEDISRWLKIRVDQFELINFIGNRMIYPNTVSITKQEVEVDLAVFREALKREPKKVYDGIKNRIFLSEELLLSLGDPIQVCLAISEVLALGLLTKVVVVTSEKRNLDLATIISLERGSLGPMSIELDGIGQNVHPGKVTIIKPKQASIKLNIADQEAQISVGDLGIIFDLRKKYTNNVN